MPTPPAIAGLLPACSAHTVAMDRGGPTRQEAMEQRRGRELAWAWQGHPRAQSVQRPPQGPGKVAVARPHEKDTVRRQRSSTRPCPTAWGQCHSERRGRYGLLTCSGR